jgi:hypothetical protein
LKVKYKLYYKHPIEMNISPITNRGLVGLIYETLKTYPNIKDIVVFNGNDLKGNTMIELGFKEPIHTKGGQNSIDDNDDVVITHILIVLDHDWSDKIEIHLLSNDDVIYVPTRGYDGHSKTFDTTEQVVDEIINISQF